MAFIGRKEPTATPTKERPKARPTAPVADNGRLGKARTNLQNIAAELRKVTWPSREETRNLTIVVIGITAVIGTILGSLDAILSYIYTLVNP